MKRRLLFLLIRVARLLKMEDKLMPELELVPQRQVRTERVYRYYGRVVLSHSNPKKVVAVFRNSYGSRITEEEYNRLCDKGAQCSIDDNVTGKACSRCDFDRLGLPCRCDFASGFCAGYYEVLMSSKQFSTNSSVSRPRIRIDKNDL